MRGRLRWYILLFVAIAVIALGLFWYSGAHAQDGPVLVTPTPSAMPYLCWLTVGTDEFGLMCKRAGTPAGQPTETPTAAATETPEPLPTETPAPTETATPEPSITATATETPTLEPAATVEPEPTEELAGELEVTNGGTIFWGAEQFGANQEVFVTIRHTEWQTGTAGLALLLLAQQPDSYTSGALGAVWVPERDMVLLYHYAGGQWRQLGAAKTGVYLWDDDVFGARIVGDTLTAYVNGQEVARANVPWAQWPVGRPSGGYIGLDAEQMAGSLLDDFGGGTLP